MALRLPWLPIVLGLATLPALGQPSRPPCPDLPLCRGCGCRGGTGYRGPDRACVGFREFDRVCGPPPHASCVFENAPNTGLNRDCVIGPRTRPAAPPP